MRNKLPHFFAFISFALFLASCAPPGVPSDAERSWSLKGNFSWAWDRNVEHGCVAWDANETYALIYLFANARCNSPREIEFYENTGLMYPTYSDQLIFRGYNSSESIPSVHAVVAEEGNRCPYTVSQSQIGALRLVAMEALELTLTDGERRILMRIDERLSKTNGSALIDSYRGCVDVKNNRARRESGNFVELWGDGSQSE